MEKEYPQSDSLTAQKDSFKTFLAIAANESFQIKTLDVMAFFWKAPYLTLLWYLADVWPPLWS